MQKVNNAYMETTSRFHVKISLGSGYYVLLKQDINLTFPTWQHLMTLFYIHSNGEHD